MRNKSSNRVMGVSPVKKAFLVDLKTTEVNDEDDWNPWKCKKRGKH